MSSLEGIFADYWKQGYEEAKKEFDKVSKEKDYEIERLKLLLAQKVQDFPPPPTTTIPIRSYNFNSSLFPKPNGNDVIDAVVELTQCKREKDQYIININKSGGIAANAVTTVAFTYTSLTNSLPLILIKSLIR